MGFALAAIPVLLLALGTIEIAHWFSVRQMVSQALLEAARAASTQHNRPEVLAQAFEQALRPQYTMGSPARTTERLGRALDRRRADLGGQPWEIRVVSPSYHAFSDFSDPNVQVPGNTGFNTIRNSYQAEQHQAALQRGWPSGQGPLSGQTIFQANTLTLEAIWPHRPYLPVLRSLLRPLGAADGSYTQRSMAQGYLPLKRHMTLTMQSHPVQWPSGLDLRVRQALNRAETCRGWLCEQTDADLQPVLASDSSKPGSGKPPEGSHAGIDNGLPPWSPPDGGAAGPPTGSQPGAQLPVVSPDDPACGVSLCCV